jgi:quinol---cytochrome c reductase iron-sulfur subunit, bacillus type
MASDSDRHGVIEISAYPHLGLEHDPEPAGIQSRRRFLTWISIAVGGLGAAAIGVPAAAFILRPLFTKKMRVWRAVGTVDSFQVGTTTRVIYEDPAPVAWTGISGRTGAWLRRDGEEQFTAFSIYCTHLGCPVRWIPDAELFMCPCHGGVYYKDGTVAAGPPPQSLATYPTRITAGHVEILTTPIPIT